MKQVFLLGVVIFFNISCSAQKIKPIIQSSRYNNQIAAVSDNYYYFGGYYIDRKKEGIINLETLKDGINNIVKDIDYNGYIILNIENKVYQELQHNPRTHKNYEKNIRSFVGMVNLVKELRPNAKVGIYNIPFMFHYEAQKLRSDYDKLYPILKAVDFYAPSLYLHYDSKQRNNEFFSNYINNNLDLNFEYAERLNKKVIPFVWYRIHPANKTYGGKEVSTVQYSEYLNMFKNYRYKNQRVEKVIYWEPA